MVALAGYNIGLAVSAGTWTPTLLKSAAGNITAASGGSAVTLPWVENTNAGSANTTTKQVYTAVIACLAGIMNDRAANGDPT